MGLFMGKRNYFSEKGMQFCIYREFEGLFIPNMRIGDWDSCYEADLVRINRSWICTEYEIKLSKADFMADFRKPVYHSCEWIRYFSYVVTADLVEYVMQKLEDIRVGVIGINKLGECDVVRKAKARNRGIFDRDKSFWYFEKMHGLYWREVAKSL